ncbi:Rab3 GTPase-activating protein regulatory subunit N-terminus-domain-containing protein [Phlyctochytrium arcticum]|nr:Rab3 GTPase-activating protein regulatory subunit N-terminus-domain-containing protein [Phlyctochytrium arcticum]
MSHRLSNSTIVSIKLRTIGRTTLEADPLDADEITFVYADKVVVSVDGPSFWMATRISAEHQEYGEPMEQPSLLYKKWILEDQETIEDVISLGPGGVSAATPPSFNPVSGCFHTLRQSFRYIGVGSPMLCLYGTYEARQHSLRAVADRMTSAVTNVVGYAKSFWPVGSRPDSGGSYTARAPHSPHDPETLVPAARIPAAFTLNDAGRKMVSIHPCPNRALAAATDSLGRVSLIDTNEGEIVRMWKGMRDAQCGWLSAASCTLLVIYTSRGALEVWDVDGDRVAGIAMGAGWRIVECQQVLGRVFGSLNSHSHIHELHLGCLLINSFGESRKFSITEESA